MIAVDTNLLIYAHREDSDFHQQAVTALQGLAERRQSRGLVCTSFLRSPRTPESSTRPPRHRLH